MCTLWPFCRPGLEIGDTGGDALEEPGDVDSEVELSLRPRCAALLPRPCCCHACSQAHRPLASSAAGKPAVEQTPTCMTPSAGSTPDPVHRRCYHSRKFAWAAVATARSYRSQHAHVYMHVQRGPSTASLHRTPVQRPCQTPHAMHCRPVLGRTSAAHRTLCTVGGVRRPRCLPGACAE